MAFVEFSILGRSVTRCGKVYPFLLLVMYHRKPKTETTIPPHNLTYVKYKLKSGFGGCV